MARTPAALYDELHIAVTRVCSAATGQYTSWHDGYLSAPDVRGVRVRLVLEIDLVTARGDLPRGAGWCPRPDDPPHDAPPAPPPAPPRKPRPRATATTAQRGLFDDDNGG